MVDYEALGENISNLLREDLATNNNCELIIYPEAKLDSVGRANSRQTVLFLVREQSWDAPRNAGSISAIGQAGQTSTLDINFFIGSFTLRGPNGVLNIKNTIQNKLSGVQILKNAGMAYPAQFSLNMRDEESRQWIYDFVWRIQLKEAIPGIQPQITFP